MNAYIEVFNRHHQEGKRYTEFPPEAENAAIQRFADLILIPDVFNPEHPQIADALRESFGVLWDQMTGAT